MRDAASTRRVIDAGAPFSGRNVNVTSAASDPGFATRMNVSKPAPVAPSASSHVADGAVTPADSCPPRNSGDVPKYIARSATPGRSNVTVIPND